jgi:hypothetical protein
MSQPISACQIVRALSGNQAALASLQDKDKTNRKFGGFTFHPCRCKPQCQIANTERMEEILRDNEWLCKLIHKL